MYLLIRRSVAGLHGLREPYERLLDHQQRHVGELPIARGLVGLQRQRKRTSFVYKLVWFWASFGANYAAL